MQAAYLVGVIMRLINQASDTRTTSVPITVSQLADVDAAFATNAVVGVRPITATDGIRWSAAHPALKGLTRAVR